MSEPENRDHMDAAAAVEGTDEASTAQPGAAFPTGHGDLETSDLSDSGVGLSVGEPNTFEPEEADPAAD